jgi:nickel transport protein
MRYLRLAAAATLASVMLSGLSSAAFGHAIWFAERHGKTGVVYGHGGTDESYDPAKLKSVAARKADGTATEATIELKDGHAMVELAKDAAIVTGFFDNGFWSKGADGKWVNEPKSKVPGATEAGQYVKYATAIIKPLGKAPEPQGLALEIVAQSDPLALKSGDDLVIQVLANGKPVEGAEVTGEYTTASEQPKLKTDAEGKVTLKVRNQGLNVITASHTEKTPGNPDGDEIGHTAALSFTLGHGEE